MVSDGTKLEKSILNFLHILALVQLLGTDGVCYHFSRNKVPKDLIISLRLFQNKLLGCYKDVKRRHKVLSLISVWQRSYFLKCLSVCVIFPIFEFLENFLHTIPWITELAFSFKKPLLSDFLPIVTAYHHRLLSRKTSTCWRSGKNSPPSRLPTPHNCQDQPQLAVSLNPQVISLPLVTL